jgi:hypothetical protein
LFDDVVSFIEPLLLEGIGNFSSLVLFHAFENLDLL